MEESLEPSLEVRVAERRVWENNSETIECIFTSSADFCLELRSRIPLLEAAGSQQTTDRGTMAPARTYKTVVGRNVDRLRKECGWSFDDLAKRTGIGKSLILGHVNDGKGMHPKTKMTYADAFTRQVVMPSRWPSWKPDRVNYYRNTTETRLGYL